MFTKSSGTSKSSTSSTISCDLNVGVFSISPKSTSQPNASASAVKSKGTLAHSNPACSCKDIPNLAICSASLCASGQDTLAAGNASSTAAAVALIAVTFSTSSPFKAAFKFSIRSMCSPFKNIL